MRLPSTFRLLAGGCAAAAVISATSFTAAAETREVRLMKQVGIASLTMAVMEHERLYEKHLAAAGLPDTKVTWTRLVGGNVVNDALLSGSLDFAVAGVVPLSVIWAKTRGTPNEVKGVVSLNSIPIYFNTRNAAMQSLKDIKETDRIALPAVKVSIQAVILQMAATKEWGESQVHKLDTQTVTLAGNDAFTALTSGQGEITCVMSAAPFAQLQLSKPGIHTVFTSYDVLGGPHSLNVVYTTAKFREQNPKSYAAFIAAFKEATDLVNSDKRRAAETYLKVMQEPISVDALTEILQDPRVISSLAPQGVTAITNFIHKIGLIKVKPQSWKDLFFSEAHDLPGN